jgi:uncharacterized repeat protein (TIGR03803 family)
VLYKFGGTADGCAPEAGLVNVKGTLYGTASGGGVNCTQGYGVAFSLDPSTGTEVVVHAFGGGTDGQGPSGGLIHVKGMLYGTTAFGGTYDGGTVFAIDPATGAETVIYSFCSQQNCADGVQPEGNLIHVNGTLYGTTYMGGAHGRGTVFALTLP